MGQEAGITDAEIRKLCDGIITAQREGIAQMEPIIERPTLKRARVRAARDRHGPAVCVRPDANGLCSRRRSPQGRAIEYSIAPGMGSRPYGVELRGGRC
jgi:hypothetical protein